MKADYKLTKLDRRLTGASLIGVCALAVASPQGHAQPTPFSGPSEAPPLGMTQQPCRADAFGRGANELAFARAAVTQGPMDQALVSDWLKAAPKRKEQDDWRLKNDWADLCRYRLEDGKTQSEGAVKVVFIGDSITELWKVADPDLFRDGVINRGISGQTSGQVLIRFQQDVVALHPKAVHILVGTNDVAGNNGPERPEDFKNNIRAMVAIAKSNRIKTLIGAIPPVGVFPWRPNLRPGMQIKSLNVWLKAFCAEEGETFIDYYGVLAGPDGAMKAGISHDGVHPVIKGYTVMRPLAEAAM